VFLRYRRSSTAFELDFLLALPALFSLSAPLSLLGSDRNAQEDFVEHRDGRRRSIAVSAIFLSFWTDESEDPDLILVLYPSDIFLDILLILPLPIFLLQEQNDLPFPTANDAVFSLP